MRSGSMVRMVAEALLGGLSESYRVIFRLERPSNGLAVMSDERNPNLIITMPCNANTPARVVSPCRPIHKIFSTTDGPKVYPFVVGSIVVDMVDLFKGPFAGLHAPNDAVSKKRFAKYKNPFVPVSHCAASGSFCVFGVPYRRLRDRATFGVIPKPMLTARLPEKFSGFRIVLKQFIQDCAIKLGLSHVDLQSRSSWSGRVQVLVTPPRPIFIQQISAVFNSNLTCKEA